MNSVIPDNTRSKQDKNTFLGVSTVIAVPALLILFIFCIIPFYTTLNIAFRDYNLFKGLFNSPWVGLKHFEEFFQSAYGPQIIQNTFVINGLSVILGGIYVFLLTLGIASIRNNWIKGLVTTFAVLPALIPVPILVSAILKNDFLRTNIMVEPSIYWLSAVANEVFCIAPVAVLAGLFACFGKFDMKKVMFITFGYVAVRFMLLFSSDLSYILNSYNPLVYESADVLGTYVYRSGLMEMDLSVTSAAYIAKTLLQLIPVIIGTIAVIFMSGKIQNKITQDNEIADRAGPGKNLSFIAVLPAAIFAWVAISSVSGINLFTNPVLGNALVNTLIFSGISCVLVTGLSISLAYGMVVGNKIVFIFNSVFLLIFGNIMGQYLQMHSLSLLNTYFPIIILNCLYASFGAYFIYFAIGGIHKISFGQFFMKALPVLITILGFGFARFYDGFLEPIIYLSDRKLYPVSLILRELIGGYGEKPMVSVSTITLLLIPVIIGISGIWIGIVCHGRKCG